MKIEIEKLNRKLANEVNVLRTLKLCEFLNQFDFPSLFGEKIKKDEYSSIHSISQLSEIDEHIVEFAINELLKKKYVDVKNDKYKINTDGLAYLYFKEFKQDQLDWTTNNPIRKIKNVSAWLYPIIALVTLGLSIRNCHRLDADSNVSISKLKPNHATDVTKQINKTPSMGDTIITNDSTYILE
ncbi:hypothetical protein [Prolixibacter sp. NT017]|uniref:hypothetical protein n=1 Tax=Prolixibacter sp. NT017 TaxID=2652390 RepID=UPI00127331AF|nr:hypothetical protein [Prolixibacter sp. NT017]GET24895.1 hypothetical protein NT017_12240 [Prolixibacter sp. NT017]